MRLKPATRCGSPESRSAKVSASHSTATGSVVTFRPPRTPGSATRRPLDPDQDHPRSEVPGAGPRGTEGPRPRYQIPLERTTSPYDVIDAFSDAATTLEGHRPPPSWRPASRCCRSRSPAPRTRSVVRSTASPAVRRRWPSVIRTEEAVRRDQATSQILADRKRPVPEDPGERRPPAGGAQHEAAGDRGSFASPAPRPSARADRDWSPTTKRRSRPRSRSCRVSSTILNANQQNVSRRSSWPRPVYRIYANVLGNGPVVRLGRHQPDPARPAGDPRVPARPLRTCAPGGELT